MNKFIRFCWMLLTIISSPFLLKSQPNVPLIGLSDPAHDRYALVGGMVLTHPGAVAQPLNIWIEKGRIVRITPDTAVPKGYIRWNMAGKWLYPAFVDLYVAISPSFKSRNTSTKPQYGPARKGIYSWNDALHPQYRMVAHLPIDIKVIQNRRKGGFGIILPHRSDGIIRGSGPLIESIPTETFHQTTLLEDAAWFLSFNKGTSRQSYPSSLMGAIALLRQTFYDMQWYLAGGKSERKDLGLESLGGLWERPAIFTASDKYDVLRILRIAKEFDREFIIRSPLNVYQLGASLRRFRPQLIIAPNFPKAPDVADPMAAQLVEWAELKSWELAPWALGILAQWQVPFVLTMDGLSPQDFWKNIRTAVRCGLPPDEALRALTTRPAQWIGVEKDLGTLTPGKQAHILITNGAIWDDTTRMLGIWGTKGPQIWEDEGWNDTRGTYLLRRQGHSMPDTLRIEGKRFRPTWKIKRANDSLFRKVNHRWKAGYVSFWWWENDTLIRLAGHWTGNGRFQGNYYDHPQWLEWTMQRILPPPPEKMDIPTIDTPEFYIPYPFVGLAPDTLPPTERVLLKNATIWTGEAEGILHNADLLIGNGKILKVGYNIADRHARIVDAKGLHITAGIIDEHSHIAISRGVNEGSHPVTSEVRIGDVINPADVNIYRQLAGGVTTVHLLHGSANPIGGQTALIKLRWGEDAEGLKFGGNVPFIKFALGENVKQSNWGDRYTVRYPQTRMGVEQIIADALWRARAYDSLRRYTPPERPLRRNLRLEALAEILSGQRHITCHSYVKSEILMLMRLAETMGFRINTFTHVLEGYKVAPELKAHGAGASTFSDWWAYKYEVMDAIPYNAAILTRMGVITAINSDDAEMGRRLNQEAAKSIKYGGLSPEEAWKLVTINPARLLHIDHRTGSIREGKDADVVIWDAPPLSSRARVLQTYIDGRRYYDREQASRRAEWVKKDKERITRIILRRTHPQERQPVRPKHSPRYRCETISDELKTYRP